MVRVDPSYIYCDEGKNPLALRHVYGTVSRRCTNGSDSSTIPVSHDHAFCRDQLVPQSDPAAGVSRVTVGLASTSCVN